MLTQVSEESIFLADFLAFLKYIGSHRIRTTTLKKHIPLHHLKDLAALMRGQEPFHPLYANASFGIRSQRDRPRIDFMDCLATHMESIERSSWGYILPRPQQQAFLQCDQRTQIQKLAEAFWSMDWSPLYPWSETVDVLQAHKREILEALKRLPVLCPIKIDSFAQGVLPGVHRKTAGLFWTVLRPLEYFGWIEGFFERDGQGFYVPQEFVLHPPGPAILSTIRSL